MDVLLDETGWLACASRDFIKRRDHLNAFTLAWSLWLHDPKLVLVLSHLWLQKLILLRAIVTCRHEVETFGPVKCLHSWVALVETIFPGDLIAPRKVIYLLKPTKVTVNVRLDNRRAPNEYNCVTLQKITVRGIRYIVKLLSRHPIILCRLPKPMLLQYVPYQPIFEIHKLVTQSSPRQTLLSKPIRRFFLRTLHRRRRNFFRFLRFCTLKCSP